MMNIGNEIKTVVFEPIDNDGAPKEDEIIVESPVKEEEKETVDA